jgi:hypothetical protein
MSNEVMVKNSLPALAGIESMSERKQKQVIVQEVQTITSEVLRCYDKADERKSEIKEMQRLLRETDQVKKLRRMQKEFKELNANAHALLLELRGIKRLVKKVNPELLSELTQIKEISLR